MYINAAAADLGPLDIDQRTEYGDNLVFRNINVMSALILTPTHATLGLTNADTLTINLSYVQNVVKDSSGCSRGNGI